MKKTYRFTRNILYFFKRIKEVGDSGDQIFYKCLKCNSNLIGYKKYGKLNVPCKCGNLATVYTGTNIHFIKNPKKPTTIKQNKNIDAPENEDIVIILVVLNLIGFIAWVIFYSFYHDYIRHFMFNILGFRSYYRVMTMFLFYFCIAVPISTIICFLLRLIKFLSKLLKI